MAEVVRVGMLGIENSHSAALTRLWQGDVPPADRVSGVRVVACLFQERTDQDAEDEKKFLAELQAMGVEKIVSRPEEMLGAVDAVAVVARDGNEHLRLAEPFLRAGLPTFVDKPLAGELAVARQIVELARAHNAPLYSASSLRHAPEIEQYQQNRAEIGPARTGTVWGPASRNLHFYGIHAVEMMSALWGPGAQWVSAHHDDQMHLAWVGYRDGGIYAVQLARYGQVGFGFTYLGEKKAGTSAATPAYAAQCRLIARLFHERQSPLDPRVSLESVAILDAFARSQKGKVVEVEQG